MQRYWLKVVGTAQKPVRDDWTNLRPDLKRLVHFPSRPRKIQAGDGIVLYAAGRRIVFAAGEVTSQPYQSRELPGYPWAVEVAWNQDATVLFLPHGVPLAEIGVEGKSVRQQSHIELKSEEKFRAAVRALHRAKATREGAS